MTEGAPRGREEKALRRAILHALSGLPDVLVAVNESNVFTKLVRLMPREIVAKANMAVLPEERFGLGIGSPDLLVVVRGVCLFLELKAGSGVSPEQRRWHETARAKGVRVEVVRSVEEARAAVERVRHGEA